MKTLSPMRAFIEQARQLNEELERNGSDCAARARGRLLQQLEELLSCAADETISVKDAAELTGASPETIRRMVRGGEIEDRRENRKGKIAIPTEALDKIEGKVRRRPSHTTMDPQTRAVANLARL